MEAARAIEYGNPDALSANEHQILYEIESRLEDYSIDHEQYMTFWIASHTDHEAATDMFEVFMNTCSTTFRLDKSEEIMELYSWAAMVGAIGSQNLDILDYIKGYQSEMNIREELCAQYGHEMDWPSELLVWYNENFS
jgi:hypothetical protein